MNNEKLLIIFAKEDPKRSFPEAILGCPFHSDRDYKMVSIGIDGMANLSFSEERGSKSTDILYIEDSDLLGDSEKEKIKELSKNKHLHVIFHVSSKENPAKNAKSIKSGLGFATWNFFNDTFTGRLTWTSKNSYAPEVKQFLDQIKEAVVDIETAKNEAQKKLAIVAYQKQFNRLDSLFSVMTTPILIRLYFLCQNVLAVRFIDEQCSEAEHLLFPNGYPTIRITDKNRKLISTSDYWKASLGFDKATTLTTIDTEFNYLIGFDESNKEKVKKLVRQIYSQDRIVSNDVLLGALKGLQELHLKFPSKNMDYAPCFIEHHAAWISKADAIVHDWLKGYLIELKLFLQNPANFPMFLEQKWIEWTGQWRGLRALVNSLDEQLDISVALACIFPDNNDLLPRDFRTLVKTAWRSCSNAVRSTEIIKEEIEKTQQRYKSINTFLSNSVVFDDIIPSIQLQYKLLEKIYDALEYFRKYALYICPPREDIPANSIANDTISPGYNYEQPIGKVLIIDDELGREYSTFSDESLFFNEKRQNFCSLWGLNDLTDGVRKGNADPVVANAIFLSGQKKVTINRLKSRYENFQEHENFALKEIIFNIYQQHKDISLILMDMTFEERTIEINDDYSIREARNTNTPNGSNYAFRVLKVIDEITELKLVPIVVLSQYKPQGIEEELSKTRYLNFISKPSLNRRKLFEIILEHGIISSANIPNSLSARVTRKQAFRNYFAITRKSPNIAEASIQAIPNYREAISWLIIYLIRKYGYAHHQHIRISEALIETIIDFIPKAKPKITSIEAIARLIEDLMEWLPNTATEVSISHFNSLPGVSAIKTVKGVFTGHDKSSVPTSLDILLNDLLTKKKKIEVPISADFTQSLTVVRNISFFLKLEVWEQIWTGLPAEEKTARGFTKAIGIESGANWARDFINRHLKEELNLFIQKKQQKEYLYDKAFLKNIYDQISTGPKKNLPEEIKLFFSEDNWNQV